jgi:transposase
MLRAKRSAGGGVAADGLRAKLIERAEGKLARTREACSSDIRQIYDLRPQLPRLERELEELRAGGPVQVPRVFLPREMAAAWPGVWLFVLDAAGEISPAQYERLDGA